MFPRMKKMIAVALVSAALGGFATHALAEKQGHMKAAREFLEKAQNQLEKATADKGGHRVAAIKLIKEAIAEVDKGIEFDNKH
jgi:membrane protein YqaA with SNARE-associated domain